MDQTRVERRLSAILVADVVGYSRLIEADEGATIAAVRALRVEVIEPLVASHRGRVVKSMGDGMLIEFGSIVDAVACAVAIQKELADPAADASPSRLLVLRIGINLGDVVVDGADVLGDAVNIAARLEQLCEPGGVLISGTAYDHMQGKLGLPLDFIGEEQVKNIERPVRDYAVRLDGVPPAQRLWRWPLRESLRIPLAAVVLLVAAGFGAAAYHFWPRPVPVVATAKPSIAVLPFVNLGSDAESGRLAEGLTDDIITDLDALPRLRHHRPQFAGSLPEQAHQRARARGRARRPLSPGRIDPARGRAGSGHRATDRCRYRHEPLVGAVGPRGR